MDFNSIFIILPTNVSILSPLDLPNLSVYQIRILEFFGISNSIYRNFGLPSFSIFRIRFPANSDILNSINRIIGYFELTKIIFQLHHNIIPKPFIMKLSKLLKIWIMLPLSISLCFWHWLFSVVWYSFILPPRSPPKRARLLLKLELLFYPIAHGFHRNIWRQQHQPHHQMLEEERPSKYIPHWYTLLLSTRQILWLYKCAISHFPVNDIVRLRI